jgi:lipoprotein signal peptidase
MQPAQKNNTIYLKTSTTINECVKLDAFEQAQNTQLCRTVSPIQVPMVRFHSLQIVRNYGISFSFQQFYTVRFALERVHFRNIL